MSSSSSVGKEISDESQAKHTVPLYDMLQTQVATLGFRPGFRIAEHPTGSVYVGRYNSENRNVAIKHMKAVLEGEKMDFFKEVDYQSQADHPNLLKVVGCAYDDKKFYTVYEYISGGYLDDHLHGSKKTMQKLDWNRRVKVASGVARGLKYFHDNMKKSSRDYCSINSKSILLDEEYNPKLCDYGYDPELADQSYFYPETASSRKSVAPKSDSTGPNWKTDVYHLGVTLLEIFTGRKAADDTEPDNEKQLVPWVQNLYTSEANSHLQMVDPTLQEKYPVTGLEKVLALAVTCIQGEPENRPPADDVIAALNEIESITYPDATQAQPAQGPKMFSFTALKDKAKEKFQFKKPAGEVATTLEFQQLQDATGNFSEENKLNEGRLATVFRGAFEKEGHVEQNVIIRKINKTESQGKEFKYELKALSEMDHPNVIQLIGHCSEGDERLTVYEDMPLGYLYHVLHGKSDQTRTLDWNVRVKIAGSVGRALVHLKEKNIIHGDINSLAILVDDIYNTKLSDFGWAKVRRKLHKKDVPKRGQGSMGYEAPEYGRVGPSFETDIFSYGVVLLEIFTGRKAFDDTKPAEEKELVPWARHKSKDPVIEMIDPVLRDHNPKAGLQEFLSTALMCVAENAKERPAAADVVNMFNSIEIKLY